MRGWKVPVHVVLEPRVVGTYRIGILIGRRDTVYFIYVFSTLVRTWSPTHNTHLRCGPRPGLDRLTARPAGAVKAKAAKAARQVGPTTAKAKASRASKVRASVWPRAFDSYLPEGLLKEAAGTGPQCWPQFWLHPRQRKVSCHQQELAVHVFPVS